MKGGPADGGLGTSTAGSSSASSKKSTGGVGVLDSRTLAPKSPADTFGGGLIPGSQEFSSNISGPGSGTFRAVGPSELSGPGSGQQPAGAST